VADTQQLADALHAFNTATAAVPLCKDTAAIIPSFTTQRAAARGGGVVQQLQPRSLLFSRSASSSISKK
jgi:hypothetical protein